MFILFNTCTQRAMAHLFSQIAVVENSNRCLFSQLSLQRKHVLNAHLAAAWAVLFFLQHTYTYIHTRTHAQAHTYTNTDTHKHRHTDTHKHTNQHTHIHTPKQKQTKIPSENTGVSKTRRPCFTVEYLENESVVASCLFQPSNWMKNILVYIQAVLVALF